MPNSPAARAAAEQRAEAFRRRMNRPQRSPESFFRPTYRGFAGAGQANEQAAMNAFTQHVERSDPTSGFDWAMWEALQALGLSPQSLGDPVANHAIHQQAQMIRRQYEMGLRDAGGQEAQPGTRQHDSWAAIQEYGNAHGIPPTALLRQIRLGEGDLTVVQDGDGLWSVVPREAAEQIEAEAAARPRGRSAGAVEAMQRAPQPDNRSQTEQWRDEVNADPTAAGWRNPDRTVMSVPDSYGSGNAGASAQDLMARIGQHENLPEFGSQQEFVAWRQGIGDNARSFVSGARDRLAGLDRQGIWDNFQAQRSQSSDFNLGTRQSKSGSSQGWKQIGNLKDRFMGRR
jgi:hypothetical protein